MNCRRISFVCVRKVTSGSSASGLTSAERLERKPSSGDLNQNPQIALADMIQGINALAEIKERTGMDKPTVIT